MEMASIFFTLWFFCVCLLFWLLGGCLFGQFYQVLLLPDEFSSLFLGRFVDILSSLNHLVVLFLTGAVLAGVYLFIATHFLGFFSVSQFLCNLYQQLPFLSFQYISFSCLYPFLQRYLGLLKQLFLLLTRNPHQFQSINNQTLLNFHIKRRISLETWGVIYLNEVRLEILGDHDIHSQNMKTHVTLVIFRLARLVLMGDCRNP